MVSTYKNGNLYLTIGRAHTGVEVTVTAADTGSLTMLAVAVTNSSSDRIDVLPQQFHITSQKLVKSSASVTGYIAAGDVKSLKHYLSEKIIGGSEKLEATTLLPGETVSGVIYFKRECGTRDTCDIRVIVPIQNTQFMFPFSKAKDNSRS